MNDKDKSYFAKLILVSVAFITFLTVLGLMIKVVKNKKVQENTVETPVITTDKELTIESLKNAEYTFGLDAEKYKFIDGSYFKAYPDSPSGTGKYVGVFDNKIVFNDFNDDGKKDVAVILDSYGGGTGHFYALAVMANHNGEPVQVASEDLGDRSIINSLEIKDGKIIIDMVVGNASCCPTDRKILEYELRDNKLVKTKETNYDEITPIDISNWKTYESSKMKFSIKVPASFSTTLDFEPGDTPSYNEVNSSFFVKNTDGNIIREAILINVKFWTNYFNADTMKEEPPSLKWIDSDIATKNNRRNIFNFKKEEFVIDNNLAVKISSEAEVSLAGDTEERVEVYSIKGNRVYIISAYIDAKQQNYYLPIFNQILSTFKFTK